MFIYQNIFHEWLVLTGALSNKILKNTEIFLGSVGMSSQGGAQMFFPACTCKFCSTVNIYAMFAAHRGSFRKYMNTYM